MLKSSLDAYLSHLKGLFFSCLTGLQNCGMWQFFHSWVQKVYSPNLSKSDCMSDVARICYIITFHLSKLWKVKFSILCGVIFLVRLQGNFDIDHSQEWKG